MQAEESDLVLQRGELGARLRVYLYSWSIARLKAGFRRTPQGSERPEGSLVYWPGCGPPLYSESKVLLN